MAQVGYIILGSILAICGGIITQVIMIKWIDKRTITALKILLTDVINSINEIIDKLKLTYEKTKIVHVEFLLQLRSARLTYDRNKEYLIRISNEELRKEISDYFDKEMLFDMVVSAWNNLQNDARFQTYAVSQIKEEVNKLDGIKDLGIRIKDKLGKI